MDTLYELRVLAGPQAGASLPLKPGASVDVGSLTAGGCQVVLRDPQVSEQRVRLHVRQMDVRIEVLAGSIDMAGQRLTAPYTLDWPCFLPVRIGDTVLAVGTPDNESRWAEALNQALNPPAEEPVQAPVQHADVAGASADDESAEPAPAEAEAPPRRRPETWLAVGGGLLTVAAFGLLAFVSIATPAKVSVESPVQRASHALAAPEFRSLRVEADADERLHVRGDLLTLADRARLDRDLNEASIEASIEVRVGEQVASAVREIYRMNGVVAETVAPTSIADVGQVQVKTSELDVPKLQHIEAAVRRDVQGLSTLQAQNTPPIVTPEPTPVVDDPGKRVASIVPGATPYVVTVDGTRYFVGALLPSGHRLASITDQQVMLDKDGKLTPLKF